MNEALVWILVGVVFIAVIGTFVRRGRVEWEGGGYIDAKENPILFWLVILGFGGGGVASVAFGLASLLGWQHG